MALEKSEALGGKGAGEVVRRKQEKKENPGNS